MARLDRDGARPQPPSAIAALRRRSAPSRRLRRLDAAQRWSRERAIVDRRSAPAGPFAVARVPPARRAWRASTSRGASPTRCAERGWPTATIIESDPIEPACAGRARGGRRPAGRWSSSATPACTRWQHAVIDTLVRARPDPSSSSSSVGRALVPVGARRPRRHPRRRAIEHAGRRSTAR